MIRFKGGGKGRRIRRIGSRRGEEGGNGISAVQLFLVGRIYAYLYIFIYIDMPAYMFLFV